MNLLLLKDEDAGRDGFEVTGPRARYLLEVMGLKLGDLVWAGRSGGPRGQLEVVGLGPDAVRLAGTLDTPSPAPQLRLVLAVPRPKFLRKIVPQVCAMGLLSLDLVRSWRVPRDYLRSPALEAGGLEAEVDEGRAQGQWTHRVTVRFHRRFEDYWTDVGPQRASAGSRWVATPGGPPAPAAWGEATVAIGPERGWTRHEVERFRSAGFEVVGLGPGILRVDTACIAGLSRAARDLERRPKIVDGRGVG